MSFSQTVQEQLAGGDVRMQWLAHFDFADAPLRVWPGYGELVTGGFTWLGFGDFVSISEVSIPEGLVAAKTSFKLSGVSPEIAAKCAASDALVKGRAATLYLQFFTAAGAPLDDPYPVLLLTMDQLQLTASGPSDRTVTLNCETPFVTRVRPRFSYLTDADQKMRFPGDRGLEFIPSLTNKVVAWPVY